MLKILKGLANERPIYHSEADFQHALAWKIQKYCYDKGLNANIRLEKPSYFDDKNNYIDLIVELDDVIIAIELKYKTKKLDNFIFNNESFNLKNHGAHNLNRYDFIKDIWRLENFLSQGYPKRTIGYAIFLTNDSAYQKASRKAEVDDLDFRIHQRLLNAGELKWKFNENKRKRKNSIYLLSDYDLDWANYSKVNNHTFDYLLVEVNNKLNKRKS